MDHTPIETAPPEGTVPEATAAMPAAGEADASRAKQPTNAALFALAAWIVPGLGHLLLGRRMRALAFFAAVGGLAGLGCAMRGAVFPPRSADPFGTLGFLADFGTGCFYLLSRFLEAGGADISSALGDYGTRVIAAAGVVNMLAIVDAYETAARRRR